MGLTWRSGLGHGTTSLVTIGLSAHPICAFIFACGCSTIWAGGAHSCTHAPWNMGQTPYCPWCAMDWTGLGVMGAVTMGSVLLFQSFFGRDWHYQIRIGMTIGLTLAVLFIIGIVTAILYDYPHGLVADWVPSLCKTPAATQ